MFLKILQIILISGLSISTSYAKSKPTLLFYCGITMVKPMTVIAKEIEKQENCIVKIIQGGSKDLYSSLNYSKKGDLYLPGSDAYIKKNKKDGNFGKSVYVGYNQAAIFVQKGNPKKIKGLDDLLNEDIGTMLCNPESGSIGKNTKKVLISYKGEEFFDEAFDATIEVGTDSRNINKALIDKVVDMAINWKTSSFWKENSPYIDIITIDEKYAPKKKLLLTELSFSAHKDIVYKFLEFSKSKKAQEIMKKYGFR